MNSQESPWPTFLTVILKVRFHIAGQIIELTCWQAICQAYHPHRPLIPLRHSLEDPLVRAVKVLFDSAHLAAIGNILKGVKKDSIYLIDKVERVLPFAQKCMHSIPCLHKRLINFQGYLSEVPLFSPRGNFNQIQTPITNCSKKKILFYMQFPIQLQVTNCEVPFSKHRDTYCRSVSYQFLV